MSIYVDKITKVYGAQRAVDNITFEVKKGEVVGFLGPNGAGKTTVMKMITCYMAPTSGTAFLDEIPIHEDPDAIKRKIGYLPEDNPLYLDMYVIDYLKFVGDIHGIPKDRINGRIREMIDFCGLGYEKHKKIGELSKGYRQRVGLAQALIHNPEILILDEPTTGLDPNQIIEIRKLIKDLGRTKTIILSSHILSEVEATCSRILIINRGKIVADGTATNLRGRAKGKEQLTVQIESTSVNQTFQAIQELPTVEMVDIINEMDGKFRIHSKAGESSRKGIFDLCVQHKCYLLEMSGVETSLEDVFRDLTN